MIEIIVNDHLAVICLPELVAIFVQALVAQLGVQYKIETKQHKESE